MGKAKGIIAVGLLLLVMIFTLQNAEVMEIRFLFWQISLSRALVIFLVFVLGLVSGLLFGTLSRRSGKKSSPPIGQKQASKDQP